MIAASFDRGSAAANARQHVDRDRHGLESEEDYDQVARRRHQHHAERREQQQRIILRAARRPSPRRSRATSARIHAAAIRITSSKKAEKSSTASDAPRTSRPSARESRASARTRPQARQREPSEPPLSSSSTPHAASSMTIAPTATVISGRIGSQAKLIAARVEGSHFADAVSTDVTRLRSCWLRALAASAISMRPLVEPGLRRSAPARASARPTAPSGKQRLADRSHEHHQRHQRQHHARFRARSDREWSRSPPW